MALTSAPQNPSSGTSGQGNQSNAPGAKQGNSRTLMLIVGVLIIVIIVLLAVVLTSSSGSGAAAVPSFGSTGGTPIYLSASQSEGLVGQLSNYYTFDLFNLSSPVNITFIENLTPYAPGNVTEGWGTIALGTNATENQSVEFYVVQTSNPSSISASIVSTIAQAYATTPQTQSGTVNGFEYTYQLYENSSGTFQSVTGWKDGYVVLVLTSSNAGFFVNQAALESIASNYT